MQRLFGTLIFLLAFKVSGAQPSYPQGYFRNPLKIPIMLAGNFGECRPGHFHSGMDIKTGGHENEPVFAAADGYVSRIKMEPGGFGHGLYITHPNGYTTLYAHLNDFVPALQRYVRQQQYAKESWTVELQLSPDQFPVKKGQQIAWSGNTGGSTAPHLHFEIRDTKTEHPLNPQLFGFDVKDTRPPVPTKLVVYRMPDNLNSYPEDQHFIPLREKNGVYQPAEDTFDVYYGRAGVGIVANDFMNGSTNTLAFLTAEWYEDDVLQGRIFLDDIGYDETRYINAYADYYHHFKTGEWSQCLFRQQGNELTRIYQSMNNDRGILSASEGAYHRIRIELKDAAGNTSRIAFTLAQRGALHTLTFTKPSASFDDVNAYETDDYRFTLDKGQLYSDVRNAEVTALDLPDGGVRIFAPTIPVHHAFELAIRYKGVLPFAQRSKVAMRYSDGKDTSGRAAAPAEKGFYKANVRVFGDYWLDVDMKPPVIRPLTAVKGNLSRAGKIVFRANDEMTGVKTFRGELDGKWILFEQHEHNWTYVFDAHCPKGKHNLVISALDENGNEATASYTFTR